MHFLQAINSDLSVLIVCNKAGGTIKRDIKKAPSNRKSLYQIYENYKQSKWAYGKNTDTQLAQ